MGGVPAWLLLVLLVLPLGLDTFAVAAALGLAGAGPRDRARAAFLFTLFEAGMPLVGLLVGAALGRGLGSFAGKVGIALVAGAGAWMLLRRDEPDPSVRFGLFTSGTAAVLLGLSVSMDELAIGFSLGLLHVPAGAAVALIALQAAAATQLGMRLGSRVGERFGEAAERLAGLVLLALAAYLLIADLAARGAVP